MSTIAQLVLVDLTTRLEAIDGTGDYVTDIGQRAFRGRIYIDDKNEIPCVSVLWGEDPSDAAVDGPLVRESAELVIQGLVTCDPVNPFDRGHELLGDMKRALFRHPEGEEHERLETSKASLELSGSRVAQREDGRTQVQVELYVRVTWGERYGKPDERN